MNEALRARELDGRALTLLGELLDFSDTERSAQLEALHASDPVLRERVERLLRAAADPQASGALARPVATELHQAAARPQPGDLIAGYRLLRLLGEGGMSTVWLAGRADGGLKREVALKLPLLPNLSGELAERFARERDVLSTLDHPNIARLFDAGVAEGVRPYIVLEAVTGLPLTAHADARQLTTRQRLALFLQVLRALEHAHSRMVVHRDIKPANILVTDAGQVKLLDFGIAKLLAGDGAAALTQDIATVLTPRYAAPEQLLGHSVTAATDIHSAGVVLYELLTGQLPWGGPDTPTLALMHAVAHDEPRPPAVSTDIDTVLLKSLAKDPAQRYASVERFAEDLQRLLDDRPILARRVPAWRRLVLVLRRRRMASAVALAGLALAGAAGVLEWQQSRESTAQRLRAEAVREFVFRMVADAEPAEGRSEVTGVDMVDAAAERARGEVTDPRLRGELLGALGHVYIRLQRPMQSVTTMQESLTLLAANAPSGDPALNQARAGLAHAFQDKNQTQAQDLAQQVLGNCKQTGAECAKALAEANFVLAACLNWQGREVESLRHSREFVRETAIAYGEHSPEMASALEFLAGAAYNAGLRREAAGAVGRARAIATQRVLRATSRIRLDLMQAVVEVDLGHYADARAQLIDLLKRPAPWYERATQWRTLGSVENLLGHPEAAMGAAESAIDVMPPGWATTAQASLARVVWSVAASKTGRHDAALATLDRAHRELAGAGFADTSSIVKRVRRHEAEALLRADRAHEAAAALATLSAEHESTTSRHTDEVAAVALALGCAQSLLGRREEAARQLDAAARALSEALPADHPSQQHVVAIRAAGDCRRLL